MIAALVRAAAVVGVLFFALVVTVIVRAWRRDQIRAREIRRRVDRIFADIDR